MKFMIDKRARKLCWVPDALGEVISIVKVMSQAHIYCMVGKVDIKEALKSNSLSLHTRQSNTTYQKQDRQIRQNNSATKGQPPTKRTGLD